MTPTSQVQVPSGSYADLTCLYNPVFGASPSVEWTFIDRSFGVNPVIRQGQLSRYYEGRVVQLKKGLRFFRVFPYDSGTYRCAVRSQDGKHHGEVTVDLDVQGPNRPFSAIADNPKVNVWSRMRKFSCECL
ncbi:hypothetical protein chiPu_0021322 [Chiloscyllium punctatum]|uniref:Ig-like domain-containing protein n=1 Tax=Chiloscyllium punctatum TaxID=137246 RepID=A0A401RPV4_CHIPU|nr:hypothetical protein [Chiloscyllium punctatum]